MILDTGYWMLDAGSSILDPRSFILFFELRCVGAHGPDGQEAQEKPAEEGPQVAGAEAPLPPPRAKADRMRITLSPLQ
jgi:hypothetical protein